MVAREVVTQAALSAWQAELRLSPAGSDNKFRKSLVLLVFLPQTTTLPRTDTLQKHEHW
jgi:hypothetical protein